MIERKTIIAHILRMKTQDETYARAALRHYADLLPWMDLLSGVRDAMKAQP